MWSIIHNLCCCQWPRAHKNRYLRYTRSYRAINCVAVHTHKALIRGKLCLRVTVGHRAARAEMMLWSHATTTMTWASSFNSCSPPSQHPAAFPKLCCCYYLALLRANALSPFCNMSLTVTNWPLSFIWSSEEAGCWIFYRYTHRKKEKHAGKVKPAALCDAKLARLSQLIKNITVF